MQVNDSTVTSRRDFLKSSAKATSVALVRKRVTIAPLSLSDERLGKLAALGAIWLERERKLAMPVGYGDSVTGTALGMLNAILA